MSRVYMRFPDFKGKAVTFSYDDGVRQDKRLMKILQNNGLVGTFNVNSGLFAEQIDCEDKGRMTKEEALSLYCHSGMEVAAHGEKHLALTRVDGAMATYDVVRDRAALESLFGCVVKGMAYAYGAYDDNVVDILRNCGIEYARTVESTENFDLPNDWLRWHPTCHHNHPKLLEMAKAFISAKSESGYIWRDRLKLFYLWGHSYEFDNNDNWNVIEEFASLIGKREDIWYATNGEIYAYTKAFDNLRWSTDGKIVQNPSSLDVYVVNEQNKKGIIRSGDTVEFDRL